MTADRRLKRSLEAMITANTQALPYREAAFAVLDQNLKRGLKPQIKTLVCERCKQSNKVVRWTLDNQIADSWGYMEFSDESVCCLCLKEDWLGPILVPKGWSANKGTR